MIYIVSVNDAIDDLMDELRTSGFEEISRKVKAVFEASVNDGGRGASPGPAKVC